MANIEIELYIDGKADLNLAEPDAWLMLTDMSDREQLFKLTKDALQTPGCLSSGDDVVAIIFRRADGTAIPGTGKTSFSITRVGQRDEWKRLEKNISEAGTWEGQLRGYVRVQSTGRSE